MKYPYLLLDADNTLFDFDAGNRHAFHEVCARYDIPDTDESFLCYERCNNAMWTAFDRGECTKDFLVIERFRLFLKEMGLDRNPVLCNDLHLQVLGQNTLMLPHAQEVCRMLSQEHRLYIVTNAVASVQRSRLEGSAIASYISGAFISEEAGASKPSAAYFDYVFSHIDGITRDNCLLVGDSLSSDIRGANNAGIPCCWYNPKKAARPGDLRIDYEIRDLRQLYLSLLQHRDVGIAHLCKKLLRFQITIDMCCTQRNFMNGDCFLKERKFFEPRQSFDCNELSSEG